MRSLGLLSQIPLDSLLVRPVIIALGRSDNHALLASHARHLGVQYIGLESEEASEYVREPEHLARWFAKSGVDGPIHIAAIDMSVAPSTLRSFLAIAESRVEKRKESGIRSQFISRSDPAILESLTASKLLKDSNEDIEGNALYLLSIARSPHNQIAIWPIVELSREGAVRVVEESDLILSSSNISDLINQAIAEASSLSLVGVINYIIDPSSGNVIRSEFGLSTFTFWSESASYTSVSEQMIRAILDLPLGDCRIIDFEEFYLQQEVELDPNFIQDPIRPFLHLFARNPRLKVKYHQDQVGVSEVGQNSSPRFATLYLYASSQQEAIDEMEHAREFMLGR